MSLSRVPIPSPNYSSRGGSGVRLIVLHTAEGARTIESLGAYFQGDVEASSHAGADDKPNTVGIFVERPSKAWTQADFNPVAVSLELCGFAAWTPAEWDAHPEMVTNAGRWIGEEAAALAIPLRLLSAGEAQGGAAGVCQHVDLGARGGGHWDCGSGFPMARALEIAGGAPSAPPGTRPPSAPAAPAGTAPPFPGTNLVNFTSGHGTAQWQAQMVARGWSLEVDDLYGDVSEGICRAFQAEKSPHAGPVDGIVGPTTWAASWELEIT